MTLTGWLGWVVWTLQKLLQHCWTIGTRNVLYRRADDILFWEGIRLRFFLGWPLMRSEVEPSLSSSLLSTYWRGISKDRADQNWIESRTMRLVGLARPLTRALASSAEMMWTIHLHFCGCRRAQGSFSNHHHHLPGQPFVYFHGESHARLSDHCGFRLSREEQVTPGQSRHSLSPSCDHHRKRLHR